MENKQNLRIYRLVPSEQLERLIKTNFLLSKGLLLFEYLCSRSDEPLFLTADAACGCILRYSGTMRWIPG